MEFDGDARVRTKGIQANPEEDMTRETSLE